VWAKSCEAFDLNPDDPNDMDIRYHGLTMIGKAGLSAMRLALARLARHLTAQPVAGLRSHSRTADERIANGLSPMDLQRLFHEIKVQGRRTAQARGQTPRDTAPASLLSALKTAQSALSVPFGSLLVRPHRWLVSLVPVIPLLYPFLALSDPSSLMHVLSSLAPSSPPSRQSSQHPGRVFWTSRNFSSSATQRPCTLPLSYSPRMVPRDLARLPPPRCPRPSRCPRHLVLLKCNACGRASSSGVGGSRAGVAWIASASGPAKPRVKGVDAAAKDRNMPVKCGSTAVAEAPPPPPRRRRRRTPQ
jgi:hypothetical protein